MKQGFFERYVMNGFDDDVLSDALARVGCSNVDHVGRMPPGTIIFEGLRAERTENDLWQILWPVKLFQVSVDCRLYPRKDTDCLALAAWRFWIEK